MPLSVKKSRENVLGKEKTCNFEPPLRKRQKSERISPFWVGGYAPFSPLKDNIETLIEFRDNAIHFVNMKELSKPLQELGFACIKNYVLILKEWQTKRSLSKYNLYLMPLAYVENKMDVESFSSLESQNFINMIKGKLANEDKDSEYDIAIKIELKFQKGNSFGATNVRYDKNGVRVTLSEEDLRNIYL